MSRYLIVANLTLGGAQLREVLLDRAADAESRFHVLVPASSSPAGFASVDETEAAAEAHKRLAESLTTLGELGIKEVSGEVGSSRPIDAIGDVIRANRHDMFDEIILSTLPSGPSRWLAMDLPRRIARAHSIPLTHVEALDVP